MDNPISSVNKSTAALAGGALATILVWVWNSFMEGHPMDAVLQGALQTIITVAIVYLGPANKA